jgi:hypothetical protein
MPAHHRVKSPLTISEMRKHVLGRHILVYINHILKVFSPFLLINQPAQQSGGQLPKSHCFEISSRFEAAML